MQLISQNLIVDFVLNFRDTTGFPLYVEAGGMSILGESSFTLKLEKKLVLWKGR
jgi:hypothetical protein